SFGLRSFPAWNKGLRMASRADAYRQRAQQCLEMAGTFKNHQARTILYHMADAWLRIAENAKKAAEEMRPAVQTQQQIQPKDKGKCLSASDNTPSGRPGVGGKKLVDRLSTKSNVEPGKSVTRSAQPNRAS